MNLSTALTILLFFYGIFLSLLGLEYYTDKRKKKSTPTIGDLASGVQRMREEERKKAAELIKNEKLSPSEQLEEALNGVQSLAEPVPPICQYGTTGSCSLRYTGKAECGKNDEVLCPLNQVVSRTRKEPVAAPKIWEEQEFE